MRRRHATGLVVLMLWGSCMLVLYRRQRSAVLDSFSREAQDYVAGVQSDLELYSQTGIEDILALAAEARGAPDNQLLAERLRFYATTRERAFQVRLLDASGNEVIRMERADSGEVRSAERLQDKSERAYFVRASGMKADQVYVSPIDYNLEYGTVESPPRPTLRFATPIFHPSGSLRGVLVINQRASRFVDSLVRAGERIAGTLMLVHPDAVYVSDSGSPRLVSRRALAEEHPRLDAWLQSNGEGGLFRERGVIGAAAARGAAPRALLFTGVEEAIWARPSAFLSLAAGGIISAFLLALALVAWNRQGRLREHLQREQALRSQIAERQTLLEKAQQRSLDSARLAALSETAATLAHELRNPLGAIVHSATLLRRDTEMSEDDDRLLGILLEEGQRLERTVSDFLSMAQRPKPRLERVALPALLETLVALGRNEPDLQGIDLALDVEEGLADIEIDPDELRQVLWNLFRNAIKATRLASGTEIRLHARADSLEGEAAVRIEIIDQGEGRPETGEQRVSGTRGTGLGLIVARGIIARYGGRFSLQPHAEGGACAQLILPRDQPATGPA